MEIKIKKPKVRKVWDFNPVTRVVHSKKLYSRKKLKRVDLKESYE